MSNKYNLGITQGLALDIDETLSHTATHWFKEMIKLFGNPENLSVEELLKKYRYVHDVPYWQSKEAQKWLDDSRNSNEMKRSIPVIEESIENVKKINEIVPIVAYITVRPQTVIEGTQDWLIKYSFPKAPLIHRPNNIAHEDGNKWKAGVLEELYPSVLGIIDDNPKLLNFLSQDYKGKVFVYNLDKVETKINAIACKDWSTVLLEVRKQFEK